MKNFLFITSFCLIFNLSAQSKARIDSLRVVFADLSAQKRTLATDTVLVNICCELGDVYRKLKNDSALNYIQKAFGIAKNNNYKPGLLKVYMQYAKYYTMQFLPVKASEYWFKALLLAEELKKTQDIKEALSRLGTNYTIMNDFKNALIYYEKHNALCQSLNDQEDYLLGLINIGVLYFTKKDFASALKCFNLCEKLNKTVRSSKIQAAALINIGKTEVALKQYDKALERFKAADNINDGFSDRSTFVNNEIAKIYLVKGDLENALNHALIALQNGLRINAEINSEVALTLSEIYNKLGNTKLAYKYFKDYSNARLAEDSTKTSQLIRLLRLDYENEKNNQKMAQLNLRIKERENRTKLMGGGLISLLVIVIIVSVYSQSLANKNKLIESQKADIQRLNESLEHKVAERTTELTIANKELKRKNKEIREALVKGQTIERERVASELHDNIGGTLSALKWRFEALDKENLSEKEQMIYDGILKNMHRAYGEVRLISHNMLPAEFEEKGLVGALGKFIDDLNTSASKTRFALETSQLHKSIRQEVALEIYICCFETINNIIKHAEATEVVLEISEKPNGDLEVSIKDNGKGFDSKVVSNGKGLKNINHRIEKINAKLEITSKLNRGSKIVILVPELFWEESMLV